MRPRILLLASLLSSIAISLPACAQQKAALTSDSERAGLHASEEWAQISAHLPDPKTASAADLETAADVLRARRFPEDALDYYNYAVARGGNVGELLNRMGVVRLELRQYDLARTMFQRVVKNDKRNAQAWNNLGATEFMMKHYPQASSDYRKASVLDKHSAVFHSNLALVYFETNELEGARHEFARALALDPAVMHRGEEGGNSAHILASSDYPKLCFEFARLAAASQHLDEMRMWLARSSEGGYDVQDSMRSDPILAAYQKDPEISMMLSNTRALKRRKIAIAKPIPSLGEAPAQHFN